MGRFERAALKHIKKVCDGEPSLSLDISGLEDAGAFDDQRWKGQQPLPRFWRFLYS